MNKLIRYKKIGLYTICGSFFFSHKVTLISSKQNLNFDALPNALPVPYIFCYNALRKSQFAVIRIQLRVNINEVYLCNGRINNLLLLLLFFF